MYNGIGLTTPRGSGTSGYVVRNLSSLRVHERNNDKSAWDTAPPKHREPDQAILEHEQKRKVEVKCLELRDELEDKGVDEDEIEIQVEQLRQKLLANLSATALPTRGFKPSDTHAMAAAKKTELSKMARALGTRPDYQEGDAFDREKQEEFRMKRIAEREERERVKRENQSRMAEQKAKWEKERKEQEKLRRKEGERPQVSSMPPPPLPTGPKAGYRDRDRPSEQEYHSQPPRSPPRRSSPPRRDDYARGGRDVRRMVPPSAPRGEPLNARAKRERSPSRSRSPPPRNRRRVDSRSPSRSLSRSRSPRSRSHSPVRRASRQSRPRSSSPIGIVAPGGAPIRPPPPAYPRGRGRGRSPSRSPSRSPARRRRAASRSLSRSSRSRSLSGSPPRRQTYRSGTPPPPSRRDRSPPQVPTPHGGARTGPPRGRSRSASTGSSMSVSTRSGRGRSRSRSRD